MEFNGPVDFFSTSGQILAPNGDLTITPLDDVVVSNADIYPTTSTQDIGTMSSKWRRLIAQSGIFSDRIHLDKKTNDPVLPLDGDIWLRDNGGQLPRLAYQGTSGIYEVKNSEGYASYTVDTFIDFVTFTTIFTPVRWNVVDVEDSMYFSRSVNNERIHVWIDGIYRISYGGNVLKVSSSTRSTVEWEMEINDSGATITAARGYTYLRNLTTDINTTSKTFLTSLNAGDFIELQAARIAGNGIVGFDDGTSLMIELIRRT
jgi:hypothetical protein